jgi:periplasmic protein TonB
MHTAVQRAPVSPAEWQTPGASGDAPQVLPTLFGQGYDPYRPQRNSFLFSFVAHLVVIALLLLLGRYAAVHRHEIQQQVMALVTDISPYALPPSPSKAGGGGGGGDRSKLQASKGALPKLAREQITPPAIVVRNENPKLPVPPTVVVPPQIKLPQIGPLGDPLSAVLAPPSNGIGSGGGIGSGSGGGVGSGHGPGVGPGYGGGIGGGVYHPGGGVSAPRVIFSPDPEFSEEARKAKYQGTVVLSLIVGPDGRPHDVSVRRSLGMGLDEKAMEAIQRWKFEPGRKDGTPVAVIVNVEVNFRLY